MLLSSITVSPDVQLHARPLDNDTVAAYVEAMANGDKFPPVTVFDDGKTLWLADGFHRVAAMRFLGVEETEATTRTGGKQEAMVEAALANREHGRPMTRAQRQEAGERLMELTQWSDREIAKRLAVGNSIVSEWRRNLSVRNRTDTPRVIEVHRAQSTYTMRPPAKTLLEVVEPEEDEPDMRRCYGSCTYAITHREDYDYFTCPKRERSYHMNTEEVFPSTCPDYATERQAPAPTEKPVNQAMQQTVFSSESQEYYTPAQFLDAARYVMGEIDLDPATCEIAQRNVKAINYYTLEDDGLSMQWYGRVWLNPPYGRTNGRSNQDAWSERLEKEYLKRNVTEAILLVKAALGYKWFEELWRKWYTCLARERLSFIKDDGTDDGQSKQATAFIYFGRNPTKFATVFGQYGRIIAPDPM